MGDDGQGSNLAAEVVSEVVGAILPGAGVLTKRAAEAVQREWRRNHSVSLRAAERVSGMSREELEEVLASQPETVPLAVQVLWASGMNGHDETLRAIGAAFGLAAKAAREQDTDGVAHAARVLRGARDLDPGHFAVLRAVIDWSRERDDVTEGRGGLNVKRAAERTGQPLATADHGLASLEHAGLIRVNNNWMGRHYVPTPLAHAILDAAAADRLTD